VHFLITREQYDALLAKCPCLLEWSNECAGTVRAYRRNETMYRAIPLCDKHFAEARKHRNGAAFARKWFIHPSDYFKYTRAGKIKALMKGY
jgi:hypothetical protein